MHKKVIKPKTRMETGLVGQKKYGFCMQLDAKMAKKLSVFAGTRSDLQGSMVLASEKKIEDRYKPQFILVYEFLPFTKGAFAV